MLNYQRVKPPATNQQFLIICHELCMAHGFFQRRFPVDLRGVQSKSISAAWWRNQLHIAIAHVEQVNDEKKHWIFWAICRTKNIFLIFWVGLLAPLWIEDIESWSACDICVSLMLIKCSTGAVLNIMAGLRHMDSHCASWCSAFSWHAECIWMQSDHRIIQSDPIRTVQLMVCLLGWAAGQNSVS